VLTRGPEYAGRDVTGSWIAEFPKLTGCVRIPVHYYGSKAVADVASMFTASPPGVTAEEANASHNLCIGWTARSHHLTILLFAEECAVAR
jgi:hypothetical protein